MNSIVGFSELAMNDGNPDKTNDYLDKILENADWLLQIINNVLDISKIESGKMEFECIPFELHDIFTHCQASIIPKAEEKGITLYCYAEPSVGKKLLGDPTKLRQVLLNILSNAVKFTNVGMVKLSSVIKSVEDDRTTVYFEVKDSGIGMTPEQLEKIFDPFVQADSSMTRKFGGTGLGLAITKNIIEMMGGTLSVESTAGIGSKFSFEIAFDTINDLSNMPREKISIHNIVPPKFDGEILLCEDNAMNQLVICEHLSRVGLKTTVAENGLIGFNIVKARKESGGKPFDIIFMDIHMPIMDGIEASQQIYELMPETPIVALTANIMSNDKELYQISKMTDCVGKPFTSQELWRCLLKYMTPTSIGDDAKRLTDNQIDEEALHKKLLTGFVRDNQEKYSEIANAMEAGNIKLAHRLAHTLKGLAAMIGEPKLKEAAKEVEKNLKNEDNHTTPQQMKTLEEELSAVLSKLSYLLLEETETVITKLSEEQAKAIIMTLKEMLANRNPESAELIDKVKELPYPDEKLRKLVTQIENYEFKLALETLADLETEKVLSQ